MAPSTAEATEWLRSRDLLHRFGISDVTLWRWVRAGKFPSPVRLGSTRSRFWARRSIEMWEAARREASR